jgi:hypothetical protein
MDDVNIYIEEIVLNGASPLSPEHVHAALSRQAPEKHDHQLSFVARAVTESLRTRLAGRLR